MRAELKALHSPDVDDLENWRPENPAHFSFLLQLLVGPFGEPGEESFDVIVCTPDWVRERLRSEYLMSGRHLVIVRGYDYDALATGVRELVDTCEGETWEDVAGCLSRLGKWEFQNYRGPS